MSQKALYLFLPGSAHCARISLWPPSLPPALPRVSPGGTRACISLHPLQVGRSPLEGDLPGPDSTLVLRPPGRLQVRGGSRPLLASAQPATRSGPCIPLGANAAPPLPSGLPGQPTLRGPYQSIGFIRVLIASVTDTGGLGRQNPRNLLREIRALASPTAAANSVIPFHCRALLKVITLQGKRCSL